MTDGGGDHTVCTVGKVKTKSQTESLGTIFGNNPKLVIIDPWANIACEASEYWTAFKAIRKGWRDAGKRISTSDGWARPDSQYREAIKTSGVIIYDALENCPQPGAW